jgi:hypothetical protein
MNSWVSNIVYSLTDIINMYVLDGMGQPFLSMHIGKNTNAYFHSPLFFPNSVGLVQPLLFGQLFPYTPMDPTLPFISILGDICLAML